MEFRLNDGNVVEIDEVDHELMTEQKWKVNRDGYVTAYFRCHEVYLHRFLYDLWPGDEDIVHHENRNKLDNRRLNLVRMTVEEHNHEHWPEKLENLTRVNRMAPPSNRNRSGFKGVKQYVDGQRWVATINMSGGTSSYLGIHETAEEAAVVYDAAVLHYWNGDGYTNLIDPTSSSWSASCR